ncbi:flagellin, partial [Clostridium haemolyticum]|uniref:flagellin N-terminal helical domain-containing protein n=1 Tax=Clostridium haemolyticum TaxID=84025 RepID=UPI0023DE0329
IRGLNQASRNAQDGISLIQTAEGALNETHAILQRMRELSVQAANDTNKTEDRAMIQKEFSQLQTEITRIGKDTQFNKQNLLTGSASSIDFQVGANEKQVINVKIGDMRATALNVDAAKVSITKGANAKVAMTAIDTAINKVSDERATLGSIQNRLEHTINSDNNAAENYK